MAQFDDNWREYCLYTISSVETNCNFAIVEYATNAGIGIAQWTFGRSWQLLNLFATDYPEKAQETLGNLYELVKPGTTAWNTKYFTDAEAQNLMSNVLGTTECIETQMKLWNMDLESDYIPLLQSHSLTDVKGSIFALSIYHQSPQAFYQIVNAVGNGNIDQWLIGALNNSIVGAYSNRQNTVYQKLNEWDGASAPPDGWANANGETIDIGGNQNWGGGNFEGGGTENPFSVEIKSLEKIGKELRLNILLNNEKNKTVCFVKESPSLWVPYNKTYYGLAESEEQPLPPSQNPSVDINANEKKLVETMRSRIGKNVYTQNMNLRQLCGEGYSDCSALCWWVYQQIGYNIGTWTGAQLEDGELIQTLGNGGSGFDPSLYRPGDLFLIYWGLDYSGFDHVEMWMDDNTLCGHGSGMGPTIKENPQLYLADAIETRVRRILK